MSDSSETPHAAGTEVKVEASAVGVVVWFVCGYCGNPATGQTLEASFPLGGASKDIKLLAIKEMQSTWGAGEAGLK